MNNLKYLLIIQLSVLEEIINRNIMNVHFMINKQGVCIHHAK
jgi:hypothetical protein